MRFAAAAWVLGTCVFAVGCGSDDSCTNGSGAIVSQTIELSNITGFDFQAGGEVAAVQGTTQQVVVRGQQNVIDQLNRDVINGIWEIGFVGCVQNVAELRVDITAQELDSVELSGAGTAEVDTQTDELSTILSGAGTMTLTGEAMTQDVELSGSGTIAAFDLVTEQSRVVLSGQGNIDVTANTRLEVELSGAGTVSYKGDPEVDQRITGTGTVVDAN